MKGMKPFHYKGGKVIRQNGYLAIYKPSHPNCTKDGYVLEHRLIMEKHIGRYLDPKEVVHHKNHKTDDNRIDNLELFDNHSSHLSHERSGIKRKPFSDKWKENIRKGRIEWLAKHSHPNS